MIIYVLNVIMIAPWCILNCWFAEVLTIRTSSINAFHAAGKCRQQVKNVTTFVKNVEIVEFRDRIWNHNEKYIQISTNMPSIGSLIHEIVVEISEMWESKRTFAQLNQAPRSKC